MEGRNFSVQGRYRYGFNGKEKDDELGRDNYDFGARIYDGRIGRWLSVDPLVMKYPQFTPYNAMANSPILYVDQKGEENIIYLVVLPSALKSITVDEITKMVYEANKRFEQLGLKTRMAVFNRTVNENTFDINKIDKTDAVAVLGNGQETLDFITKKDPKAGNWFKTEGWGKDNKDNPEKAEMSYIAKDKYQGKWIAINTVDLSSTHKSKTNLNLWEWGALCVMHGAGHTAGLLHAYEGKGKGKPNDSRIMLSAGGMNTWIKNRNEYNSNLFLQSVNKEYITEMKIKYGNNKHKINYTY